MSIPQLQDVFKTSGVPTYTFVEPTEFNAIKVALRTAGKGLVIEGPSGIGKTTAVTKALENSDSKRLSARRSEDVTWLSNTDLSKESGTVLIDDFHRLPDNLKAYLADCLKLFADEERTDVRLVLLGINKAGETLLKIAPDLLDRVATFRLEANPQHLTRELIAKGEDALNTAFTNAEALAEDAIGSFQIAQNLCHKACLMSGVLERTEPASHITQSVEQIRESLLAEFKARFFEIIKQFSIGTKFRPSGRAPYLHLLKWLSESDEWSLDVGSAMNKHPEQRGSVSQVVEKQYLKNVLEKYPDVGLLLNFDEMTKTLSCDDPKLFYYLKHLNWSSFAKRLGYTSIEFKSRYDFALSFAGADRPIAEALRNALTEEEVEVFYDRDEEARILARDVEQYLSPIYRSESRFVVAIMGEAYPNRIWTVFESTQFADRFGDEAVIPVWVDNHKPSTFDPTRFRGYFEFDTANFDQCLSRLRDLLLEKINIERQRELEIGDQLKLEFESDPES